MTATLEIVVEADARHHFAVIFSIRKGCGDTRLIRLSRPRAEHVLNVECHVTSDLKFRIVIIIVASPAACSLRTLCRLEGPCYGEL